MGDLNLIHMWGQMGFVAKAVASILFFMSFWSVGVFLGTGGYYFRGK